MKTQTHILLAFILNLTFAILEGIGGIFIGSIAILSDAIHDMGDAISIGISYILEKKSQNPPDKTYTCGYARFSVLGSVLTTFVLLFGSVLVIISAIHRIINPTPIAYDGMIIFAVFGVAINLAAAIITRGKGSLNQKAVNLHMLEDVLGWVVVLAGSIIMRVSNFYLLDPIMSIGVALFILVNALLHLKTIIDLFLEKIPHGISLQDIQDHILSLDGVSGVHHIHIWSMDGLTHYATMHIITNPNAHTPLIKKAIKEKLATLGIPHVTLEFENFDEVCQDMVCQTRPTPQAHHHAHHHHHH